MVSNAWLHLYYHNMFSKRGSCIREALTLLALLMNNGPVHTATSPELRACSGFVSDQHSPREM